MEINNMEQNLTKQDVIKIVQEQMQSNFVSGTPMIPPHTHDKVNNIQIKEKDLILNLGTGGTVLFRRNATYTFYLLNKPRVILFNGIAYNGTSSYTTQSGISAGATIAVLSSAYGGTTEYINIIFSDGEQKPVLFTNGSLTISWSGGLTNSVSNELTTSSSTVVAHVNGSSYLQNSWSLQPGGKSAVVESTQQPALAYPLQGKPYYLQGCSYMTIDTTSIANTTVGVSGQYLVYIKDSTGMIQASMQITPSTNSLNNIEMVVTVGSGWSIYGEFIIY